VTGRALAVCLALVALTSMPSCGSARSRVLPPPVPTMTVVMREYRFEHAPVVPAGRVVFRVHNAGRLRHELGLERLPDDFHKSIGAQLRASRADPSKALVLPTKVVLRRDAGKSGIFAVDLVRGRYAMVSFLKGGDGKPDWLKGMSSEFRVR
jgi:hypothetical protein